MKKTMSMVVVLMCVLLVSGSLLAKQTIKKEEVKKEPPEFVIPEKECQYLLTEYKPSANIEYQPGVDVHGKPVMEADLTPAVVKPPEKYSFDITVDVAKHMGLTTPTGVLGEAKIGTVTVENGQIRFNGNPLEGDAQEALREICAAQAQPKKTSK